MSMSMSMFMIEFAPLKKGRCCSTAQHSPSPLWQFSRTQGLPGQAQHDEPNINTSFSSPSICSRATQMHLSPSPPPSGAAWAGTVRALTR